LLTRAYLCNLELSHHCRGNPLVLLHPYKYPLSHHLATVSTGSLAIWNVSRLTRQTYENCCYGYGH
jgi:hypothetical protein